MIKRISIYKVDPLILSVRNFIRWSSTQTNAAFGIRIKELNEKEQFTNALSLFNTRKQSEMCDLAINQALQACIHLRDFQRGSLIYQQLSLRSLKCRHIQTSLIRLFVRSGDVKLAEEIFSSIPNKERTPFLYTAMINGIGLIYNNRSEDALSLFETMTIVPDRVLVIIVLTLCANLANERSMKLGPQIFSKIHEKYSGDTVVMTSALNMFVRIGDMNKAKELFTSIKSKTIVSYGAMIKGYLLNENPLEALNLFSEMKRDGIQLDVITYVLVVQACSKIGMIEYCRSIVNEIPQDVLKTPILQNALVDMWGKAGLVVEAENVFRSIENPDGVSFGAMINAYGHNGMGSRAIDLYKEMPSHMHNYIADLCVLNACSHSGLVNEARSIFNGISTKTEKITTAMIDCLSRNHRFDEAEKVLRDYERTHAPCAPMYMAIMGGARTQHNSELSEQFFFEMKNRFPHLKEHLVAASVLLSNTYCSTEKSDQSESLKKEIRESSIRPQVGRSWTCVNGQLVEFRAHDRSHPQSDEIYREIDSLTKELIEHGHKFDSRWITRTIGKDETIESVLSGHSERLAIALNFIQKPIPSPIQITKNLRICGDCHTAIKLIAQIRQHEIIVRDANRIHHFHRNGECSCGDYF